MSSSSLAAYRTLVRDNTNFRYLWLGQIVSLLGDWFNLIASAALIGALTDSGLAVGGLFVVRMLAPFAISPIAGVAADRHNRKHLLILTDIGRAVVVLGFLLVREPSHVWLLYALTAVQLGLSGFFFPARNAILPDIVAEHELGTANALSSATWSVMLGLGAALGGLFAGQWGAYAAFILDALTFVGSAILIARVRYTPPTALAEPTALPDGARTLRAGLAQYVDGLRYVWQHKDILVIALHKGAFALIASGAMQVIQVRISDSVFVIGAGGGTGLGVMYAITGIGTGLGPIAARHFTGDRDRPQRRSLTISYLIAAAGGVIMAPLVSFPVLLTGILLRGIGGGIGWVFSTQLLLQLVPNEVRGRVFSTEYALFTLMNAMGAAFGGWGIDQPAIGITGLLWLNAGLLLIPAALWALWVRYGELPPEPASLQAVDKPLL